jgi:uncharacterized protein (TIGR03437 family)
VFIRSLVLFLCSGFAFAAAAPTFPALTYSTYLRDNFTPSALATDSSGNIYMAGTAIVNANQATVLVVKLNPQATQYLYTRFVGGSISDGASAIAVDSAGNAYVAGSTNSPDFPVTSGGNFVTAPTGPIIERSFVFKLDPNGQLVYSALFGGSTYSFAQAVAVNVSGEALVSGTSNTSGFPSTPGVYNIADTAGAPYLLELNATGTAILFSATGIGGSAITFDSSGNIYMAGTTGSLTYPTTPGSYQPTFPVFQTCIGFCQVASQGPNQYVTKLDPTGTKMIFSTAVSGSGNTLNNGLAVDAEGNVYLTGLAGVSYPYTVPVPTPPVGPAIDVLSTPALPFLSKLDPAGQKLLFSVPVGGAGVQVDSNGSAYVGGIAGTYDLYNMVASIPALANVPTPCLPTRTQSAAYVSQVDAASGNLLGSQFLGSSPVLISGVALSGTTLWITGATSLANFPFSVNALTTGNLGPTPVPGAYLGAVDFSQPQPSAGTPQIGCVVDAADLEPAGPIVPYQLLTIFGSGLGPAMPAIASNYTTTTLGGVKVSFGSLQAPLLYASSNQINLAVPLVPEGPVSFPAMQVALNGVSSPPLAFPVTSANPSLFVVPGSFSLTAEEFAAVALNADGSQNSPINPAQLGSVISVFVNGLATDPDNPSEPPDLYAPGEWSVTSSSQINPFVLQVGLQVPSSSASLSCQSNVCTATFEIYDLFYLSAYQPGIPSGLRLVGDVYLTQ